MLYRHVRKDAHFGGIGQRSISFHLGLTPVLRKLNDLITLVNCCITSMFTNIRMSLEFHLYSIFCKTFLDEDTHTLRLSLSQNGR